MCPGVPNVIVRQNHSIPDVLSKLAERGSVLTVPCVVRLPSYSVSRPTLSEKWPVHVLLQHSLKHREIMSKISSRHSLLIAIYLTSTLVSTYRLDRTSRSRKVYRSLHSLPGFSADPVDCYVPPLPVSLSREQFSDILKELDEQYQSEWTNILTTPWRHTHTQISDLFEGLILRSHPIGSKSTCNRVSQPPRRLWYSIAFGFWPRCLRTSKFLSSIDLARNCMHLECFLIPSFKNDCTSTAYWYMRQHHEHKHENLELWRH